MKLSRLTLTSAIILLLLVGCRVGPQYIRPAVTAPPTYRGASSEQVSTTSTPANSTTFGDLQWTEVFRDPTLHALIAEALANNYDLKVAAERVLEQQDRVGITRSQQFPTVSGGGSYTGVGLPTNFAKILNNGSNHDRNLYAGGFSMSAGWNLDFWGLYRRQTEAARAELLATEWGRKFVICTIVEDVASSYLQLRTLDQELAITKQTVDARSQSLQLTRTLEVGGSASMADVRQAEELLDTAEAEVPDFERQILQEENAISILLGRDPGNIVRNSSAAAEWPDPDVIPDGLPSELLERRPDIEQAEAALRAANANIGVAKARLFPQLSLSGSGGTSTSQLRTLANGENLYWLGSGNLAQVIFDGGELHNNVRLSEAAKEERVFTYQKTVKKALQDVSDALIAVQKYREYAAKEEALVEAARDASHLAHLRYEHGSTGYIEVLTTDTTFYSARLALAQAHQGEILSIIQLYSALGGGWKE